MRILFCCMMCLAWLPLSVSAQLLSPDELEVKIQKDVEERDIDALMESLSSFDDGNLNLVMLRGMTGSVYETQVIFKSVIQDERVRKLHEKLQSLDKAEASKIVTEAFDKAFADVKKPMADGSVVDHSKNYGLHAKLWLTFEFSELREFNRRFKAWLDYSYQSSFFTKAGDESLKASGPELLMYLSLVYMEEIRSGGDGSAVAALIKEAGIEQPFRSMIDSYRMPSSDARKEHFEDTKNRTISVIRIWNGLGRLGRLERDRLMRRVGALIDPSLKPNVVEQFGEKASNWVQKNITPKFKEILPKPMHAMELEFLGPIPDSKVGFMARAWKANLPPGKEEFMCAIDVIQQHALEANCDRWKDCVEAIKLWVADLPEEGVEAKARRIYFRWPEKVDGDKAPQIRLSMQGIKALTGSLEKENAVEENPAKPARIKFTPVDRF